MATVVVGAIASAVAGGFSVGAAGIAFSLTASSFLTSFATSLVLGGLSRALQPDAPKFDFGNSSFSNAKSGGLTQQVRQPITEHRVIYGVARVSGPLALLTTSEDNKYLHVIIVLAAHEIEAIDEVWIDDTPIAVDGVDGNGLVNDGGFYDGLVRIRKYLGTDAQTADTDLVSEVAEWTSNHRGRGRAYLYIRYEFDRDKFNKIPTASAFVRGKNILDTRDSTTKFTVNPALMARDYLVNASYGFGESTANIDDDFTDSAANECEEFVTTEDLAVNALSVDDSTDVITLDSTNDILEFQLGDRVTVSTTGILPTGLAISTNYYVIPYQYKDTARIQLASSYANALSYTDIDLTSAGTGTLTITKNAEPRYAAGGVLETSIELEENLRDILSGMGGQAIYAGGAWRLKAAAYESPTVTLDEDDFIGPITVNTKLSRKDRFNKVKGVYVSPINLGQPSDYPPVNNSTYETQDGESITKPFDLPFTQRPHTAQRMAKIELEKSRQEITVTAICNLRAMQIQAGDTVQITNERFGWSSKVFEVIQWKLINSESDGAPQIAVELLLRETASTIYDWNSGEETTVDPAPNSNLPDPFTVPVVTGFSLDSIAVVTQNGDKIFSIFASWALSQNQFVLSGGRYEIYYKETTETLYRSYGQVDGDISEIEIVGLQADVLYDLQIYAYNSINVKSAATEINNFQVGTTVTTNTEDWENETLARDGDDWETDTLTSEDWES